MARQNERKMKLYMEAGLAVLLVLTIALASVSGRLSSQAHEKDKNKQEAAVQGEAEVYEKNKGNDQEKNEVKDQRENNFFMAEFSFCCYIDNRRKSPRKSSNFRIRRREMILIVIPDDKR